MEKKKKNALKGVQHLWALFLKTWCIFSKNKATLDKVFYKSGLKCSKEIFKNQFYFSGDHCCEVTVKKKCAKINIFNILSHKSITT